VSWQRGKRIVTIESAWVRMIAEEWRDEADRQLEYWRVERAPSLIVAAAHNGRLLIPQPQFRPGLGRATLDLPGGRWPEGRTFTEAAAAIVARELGVAPEAIGAIQLLNEQGWPINSSFSNQLLFAATATIDPAATPTLPYESFTNDAVGLRGLLQRLECLQCRAVVLELLVRGEGVGRAWGEREEGVRGRGEGVRGRGEGVGGREGA
jgi:ADP-ribose pyrophosphatase YjhB (NUDIX family)